MRGGETLGRVGVKTSENRGDTTVFVELFWVFGIIEGHKLIGGEGEGAIVVGAGVGEGGVLGGDGGGGFRLVAAALNLVVGVNTEIGRCRLVFKLGLVHGGVIEGQSLSRKSRGEVLFFVCYCQTLWKGRGGEVRVSIGRRWKGGGGGLVRRVWRMVTTLGPWWIKTVIQRRLSRAGTKSGIREEGGESGEEEEEKGKG